jgi:hypothetical protein
LGTSFDDQRVEWNLRQTIFMQQNACHPNGPQRNASPSPTALALVSALTEKQHQQLRDFAAARMRKFDGSAGMDRFLGSRKAEDLVHAALEKVLAGEADPKNGRRLSHKNRRSAQAFLDCLKGIINSLLSNARRRSETRILHLPFGCGAIEDGAVTVADPSSQDKHLELRDTQRVLLARLRQIAEPEMLPLLDDWEANGDFIAPEGFDRRLVYRARVLTQQVLTDMARELLPATQVTGMEMLL